MARIERKLERLAAGLLEPGEWINAAAKVARPGYIEGMFVALIPAAVYIVLTRGGVGLIGDALIGAAFGAAAVAVIRAVDKRRVADMTAKGVPISTVMLWGATPTRLLMFSVNPYTGASGQFLGAYPLQAITTFDLPAKTSAYPRVRLSIGDAAFTVEFLGSGRLKPFAAALGRSQA